jgi:hypothetical protein
MFIAHNESTLFLTMFMIMGNHLFFENISLLMTNQFFSKLGSQFMVSKVFSQTMFDCSETMRSSHRFRVINKVEALKQQLSLWSPI